MTLDKNAKIYVAGHRGLVGSAIWRNLQNRGYTNLIGRTHRELDLTDQLAVKRFFDEENPERWYWQRLSWAVSWQTRFTVLISSCKT